MKSNKSVTLIFALSLSCLASCQTTHGEDTRREGSSPAAQPPTQVTGSQRQQGGTPSTVREAGPRTVVKSPVPCPLGGSNEGPSTNSKPESTHSIEVGVETQVKDREGKTRYGPFLQHRCK